MQLDTNATQQQAVGGAQTALGGHLGTLDLTLFGGSLAITGEWRPLMRATILGENFLIETN